MAIYYHENMLNFLLTLYSKTGTRGVLGREWCSLCLSLRMQQGMADISGTDKADIS